MAKPSAIDQLNPDDKFWLDTWFKDKGFCGYVEIAEILMERGYSISKSSVHRYGQKLEQKLAAVQASTQAATAIIALQASREAPMSCSAEPTSPASVALPEKSRA